MLPDLDDGQIVDIADKWPEIGLEERLGIYFHVEGGFFINFKKASTHVQFGLRR